MQNKIFKDAMILTAITLISGLLLGLVYEVTKSPIAKAQEDATQKAYQAVFTDADSFENIDDFSKDSAMDILKKAGNGLEENNEILNCVSAMSKDGQIMGYVVNAQSHAGYGGDIALSVGIQKDGTVNGYAITSISETAGLGMNAKGEKFMNQFKDKLVSAFQVVKSGAGEESDIEAISGATITSKAVTGAVNASIVYVQSLLEGGDLNE